MHTAGRTPLLSATGYTATHAQPEFSDAAKEPVVWGVVQVMGLGRRGKGGHCHYAQPSPHPPTPPTHPLHPNPVQSPSSCQEHSVCAPRCMASQPSAPVKRLLAAGFKREGVVPQKPSGVTLAGKSVPVRVSSGVLPAEARRIAPAIQCQDHSAFVVSLTWPTISGVTPAANPCTGVSTIQSERLLLPQSGTQYPHVLSHVSLRSRSKS